MLSDASYPLLPILFRLYRTFCLSKNSTSNYSNRNITRKQYRNLQRRWRRQRSKHAIEHAGLANMAKDGAAKEAVANVITHVDTTDADEQLLPSEMRVDCDEFDGTDENTSSSK